MVYDIEDYGWMLVDLMRTHPRVLINEVEFTVESMPYFNRAGELAGILSMHHTTPGRCSKRELMMLRLIAGRLGALWHELRQPEPS